MMLGCYELDKLINIAKSYREGTISESLFMDVVGSRSNKSQDIFLCKEYLRESGITITGEDEVEDTGDEIES